jgi:hypothetical protein
MELPTLLPSELVEHILAFVPPIWLVRTNRFFYDRYHMVLRKSIPLRVFPKYVRDTVARDNEFVFQYIARENVGEWLQRKEYRYKNMVFNNWIYFLYYFCVEHDSEHCRQILLDHFSNLDLKQNLHKKNIVKYINTSHVSLLS